VYFTSLPFKHESSIFTANALLHILISSAMPPIVFTMRVYMTQGLFGIILGHLLSFVPSFSSMWGIYAIAKYQLYSSFSNEIFTLLAIQQGREKYIYNHFDWNIGLQPLIFLILSIPLYLGLLLFFELRSQANARQRA
jgi:hypothetical protein